MVYGMDGMDLRFLYSNPVSVSIKVVLTTELDGQRSDYGQCNPLLADIVLRFCRGEAAGSKIEEE